MNQLLVYNWEALLSKCASKLEISNDPVSARELRRCVLDEATPSFTAFLERLKIDPRFVRVGHQQWGLANKSYFHIKETSLPKETIEALRSYGKDIPCARGQKPYKYTARATQEYWSVSDE